MPFTNNTRVSIKWHNMLLAQVTKGRASCARRQVGAVLVDKNNNVLATGYNGPPRGVSNCTTTPCPGAAYKSGQGLDKCQAIHAEQNALLRCSDVDNIHCCYVTTSPCITCTKLLMNTGCQTVYYYEAYNDIALVEALWSSVGRTLVKLDAECTE